MNVSLPDLMKAWVEEQTKTGQYSNASDYVRDVVAGVKPRLFAAAMKWENGTVASLRNVLLQFLDAKTGYRHQSQVRTG
jgi:putative addiction module CopG family antidote